MSTSPEPTGWTGSRGSVKSFTGALRHLRERLDLSDSFVGSATKLRHLRNEAAHSPDFAVSPAAAEDFFLTALSLAEVLERLTPS